MTPLIDMVFQLLLFFALTSSISEARALRVNLPAAATADREREEPVVLVVTSEGRYLLEEGEIPADDLPSAIRSRLAGQSDRPVRIEADEAAEVGPAIRALDAARAAGARSASIATRHLPADGDPR